MTEYTQARRAPGQVVTIVVAGLFLAAATLDATTGTLDTLVHLGFGLAGIALCRTPRTAKAFLIGGGITYVLLWQFGPLIDPTFLPLHTTSVVVHLSLFASMVGLAVLGDVAPVGVPEFAVSEFAQDRPQLVMERGGLFGEAEVPAGGADRFEPEYAGERDRRAFTQLAA